MFSLRWWVAAWKKWNKKEKTMTEPYHPLALSNMPKRSGWRLFLQSVFARAYPRLIGQQREKSWVFFDVFLPLLSVSAYVLVYRAMHAPEDYIGFVIVGGAMLAFWMNVLWSMSMQLYWEKEQGNLALYIIAPNSMMSILLGMAIGGLLATTLRALAILVLGVLIFKVHFVVLNIGQLFGVFLLTMVALYGMGMMFASVFLLLGREAWAALDVIQEPVYLVSGFFFPVRVLPFWVAAAASVIPLTLGLDAMRQLTFETGPSLGFLSVSVEISILAFLAALFLLLAKVFMGYVERLAIREGRLTEARR
jgi:ABC-2 type transport system permease protein